jgi:hypothetical protein
MQFIKGTLPPHITTMRAMREYLYSKVDSQFKANPACRVVVFCVDKKSPDVKSMICHKVRYEIRCKDCKKMSEELPYGKTAGSEHFAADCTKGCIGKQIMWFDDGPYLTTDKLPEDWSRFSSDNNNLRRAFYPHVWNWFLEYVPPPGKLMLLHGLPGNERIVTEESADFTQGHHVNRDPCMRIVLVPFQAHQLPLPDSYDYDNVYVLEHVAPPASRMRRERVPEMRNSIAEADNAVFYYSQFYPEFNRFNAYINDGDAFSIGWLRALEDLYISPKEHWIALRLAGKEKLKYSYQPTIEYVNLTLMTQKIQEAPEFVSNKVQCPVATMVFLVILSGTDFFGPDFCYGIGRQTGVWDTFFERLDMFHHMVQYYRDEKSYTLERRMVLDEPLFAIFTQFCYTKKYEKAAKGLSIQAHCAKLKKKECHYPTAEDMRLYGRQAMWNANYWANACRNIYIDPYERFMDASYWGYDEKTRKVTTITATKQKPLDEVHKRHMWERRQQLEQEPIPEKRKRSAMDAVKGI